MSLLKSYPYHVFLIILNEFCERFSYYGLRTVLYIYLTEFVRMDNDTSTAIYHAFTCLCYFSPILGKLNPT
jgi:dipeptide/tripeptide permease